MYGKTLPALFAAIVLSHAAVVPKISLEEAVRQSDRIVSGSVVRSWTAWGPSHQYIWTHYEVRVGETLKGTAAETVTISEPGGTLEGRGQILSGTLAFAPGEQVILFLHKTEIGYLRTVGWSQGKYTVKPNGHVVTEPTSAGAVDVGTVSDFHARVTQLVRKTGGSR